MALLQSPLSSGAQTPLQPQAQQLSHSYMPSMHGLKSMDVAPMDQLPDLEFCHRLPKVELHAHLNGSLRDETILELLEERTLADLKAKGGAGGGDATDAEAMAAVALQAASVHILAHDKRTLKQCFQLFDTIHSIVSSPAIVTRITKECVEDFAKDNVKYLELRTTPRNDDLFKPREYVEAVLAGLKACEEEGVDCVTRLLLSINRSQPMWKARETVDLAIELAKSTKWVVGIDFSGNPTINSFVDFRELFQEAREAGLKVSIHAGEVPHPKDTDAILDFQPDRLGHMLVFDAKQQARLVKDCNIPIEICPTSNIRTLELEGIQDHPCLDNWLELQYPIVLCTDDKGVFGTTLTREYVLVARSYKISRYQVVKLVQGSLSYCFDAEAAKALKARFDVLCQEALTPHTSAAVA